MQWFTSLLFVFAVLMLAAPDSLAQVITPFSSRFTTNAKGDIAAIGNTLMTCPAGATCTTAQAGTGSTLNNNDFAMIHVDVDGNAATFNSSRATLALPSGASVLFAGLYWGADTSAGSSGSAAPNAALRTQVSFLSPVASSYATLTGTQIGISGTRYHAFANVTSLVQAAGNGIYTIGNVQAGTGADRYSGWSLVVVYADATQPPRNLTVFDGLAIVSTSAANVSFTVSGFLTPPSGTVNTRLGTVGYEGDLGFTGDTLRLNSTNITNSLNPSNNFFNSSTTRLGTRITAKTPDYVNNLGFDIDVFDASGILANNATSATISLTTSNETYFPAVVTFATELYAPNLNTVKGGTNLTRSTGENFPGDIIEYTLTVSNSGQDSANSVVLQDPIPANTTYVPGSLSITTGANAGTKTDASGDDQAEFDSGNNRVVFRLGTGATAAAGGTLAAAATTTIKFRVQINANATANTVFSNLASLTAVAATLGQTLTQTSNQTDFTINSPFADLSLSKTVSNPNPSIGTNVTYTVTLSNAGPQQATGVVVQDQLPVGVSFVSASTSQGTFTPGTGVWTVGSVASGGSAILQIVVTINSFGPLSNNAQVTASNQPDPDSTPGNGFGNGEDDQASITTPQNTADLRVTKTASTTTPNVGSNTTFTITVTNVGPDAATNVAVSDPLPIGLTFVSATPSQGTYNSATGAWMVGSIPASASRTLQIVATATQTAAVTNTAQVAASDQFDPNSTPNNNNAAENDQASVTITGQQADLSLAKTVNQSTPNVGANITYTLTLSNSGPSTATGVQVLDQLPAEVTFVSATPSRGTYNSATGVWNVGSVNANTNATLQIVATVIAPTAITNSAQVIASDQPDPDSMPGNGLFNGEDDQASVTTQQGIADLSLTKTANTVAPNVSGNISFTITVTNSGPNSATGVVVTDTLDANLSFISASTSQGLYNPATGEWTVGTLANGASATLVITGTILGPQPFTNTAQVSDSDQLDPNSTPNNNNPAENDQASVVITPQRSDLSLAKSVSNSQPSVGQQIVYTLTVNNDGPNTATGVVIKDLLPAGVSFVSATPSQGSYNQVTGLWTVGGIANGGTATLQITVLVNVPTAIINTAEITASDQFDPDSTPGNGVGNGEDDQTTVVTQQGVADLSLTKAANIPAPNVGANVTFTVIISNAGPNTATNVTVTDQLAAGLSFVSATPSQGSYNATNGVWTIGSIPSGQSRTLQIVATVTQAGAISNTAQVSDSDQPDPNSTPGNGVAGENDQASTIVTGQQADLSLGKSVSNPQPNIGQNITYTVTLSNNGPSQATGVQVLEQVPGGTTFVSAVPSRGTYNQATGLWNVGSINAGISATLQLTVTVNTAAVISNTAQIIAADQPDPDSTPNNNNPAEDDQASVTTQQGVADLSLTKTANTTSPNVGENVSFTVNVFNGGPNSATNVQVLDKLPAGLNFVNATPSQGSYDPVTGIWDIGTLPAGATATLIQITATVGNVGPFTNTAQVSRSDQSDPNSTPNNNNPAENDQASVVITPQQADLALAKSVSNSQPNIGQNITFTVTLTNSGPNAATHIQVRDQVPAGTTLVNASPSQGSYDPITGVWTISGLAGGGTAVLQMTVTVNTASAITNSAEIIAVDQFDPDSTPGNGVGNGEDDQANVTTQQGAADLSLTKTVNNPAPNVGANVTYTITVSNAGPNTATNVAVTDQLAAGLTFVSANPSQGSYNSINGVWNVGSIPSGQSRTLQIVATVTQAGAIGNTAEVSASDQTDPNSTPNNGAPGENDQASTTVTGQQADLSMAKSVSNSQPNIGQNITFTITLSNAGPSAATGVQVLDQVPAGTTFVSATPSRGTYDQNTGLWNVGSIMSGISATLQVTVTVNTAAAITNVAQVIAADQPDPDSTPNNNIPAEDDQATVITQQGIADLSLTKTASTTAPNVGEQITFTVTVTNAGPNTATNVAVSEQLSSGLNFVSATPGQGQYNSATGLWTIGSIPAGTSVTLQLTALVTSPHALTNTAQVSDSDQADPNSTPNNNNPAENDQASVSITPQQADLSLAKTVSNSQPNIGDPITFTVTLTNHGPSAATGIQVRDAIPLGTTFVSAVPSLGAYSSATGIWTLSGLASGGTATLQVTLTVNKASAVTNTAEVIVADQFDPDSTPGNGIGNSEDDQVSATTQQGTSDLSLTKTASSGTPNVGANVTFTITISNAGPNTATNVAVTDQLAFGLTFVSANPSQGSYNSTNGVWTIGSIPSGQSRTLQIVATVTQPGAIANTAEVTASDQVDPNSTPNNGVAGENDQAGTTVTGQQADLSLAKSVSNPQPNLGQNVTFTITLNNDGPSVATGVQIRDQIPAGTTFVSATPSRGTYDQNTGIWDVGFIGAGISANLLITVTVNTAGAITNTAEILAADQPDPDSTPNNNVPSEDDQTSVSTQQGTADLRLTKIASTTSPNVGDNISFTVSVFNGGPNTATNVQVLDQLPAGLGFVNAIPSQGTYDPISGIWNIGSLPAGATASLIQITATVSGVGPFTNTAQVTASDQFDPNSVPGNNNPAENDQSSVVITPQQADLSLAKTVNNQQPNIGDQITFTITLNNSGPNGATNIMVRDQVPLGTTFVSANPSQGTYNPATGIWSLTGLAAGGTAVLQLTVTVNTASALTNTAELIAVDQFDPDSTPGNGAGNGEDDQASAATQQGVADLRLAKSSSNGAPNVGANVTFTLTVSNTGPNTATNVEVTDQLPFGLTFVSANPSQGNYNSVNGAWTVGSIPSGQSRTLQITATVTQAGAITNTAEVSASDQSDPNSTPNNGVAGENDQASTTVTGQQADLSLAKAVSNPQPNIGQNITFTITVSNNGPSTATGVQVRDQVPAGTTFVSATPSRGTYDQNTGIWNVGSIGPDINATLQLVVTVNIAGAVTNTAQITAADQPDPDSTPDNNDPNEDDQTSVSTQQGVADLSLTKVASTTSPNVGDNISFTVSVFNGGPNTATNVQVLDQLPGGLAFVNAIPSQGTYDPISGIWNIGSLPAGTTASLIQITATVSGVGPFTNTAQVSHSDQFDPNSVPNNNNPAENDQASVVITPQQADLALAKTVNNQQPNIGENIIFTLTLTNAGPNAATNILVRDQVPLGTTFVSANPSQGVYNPATGLWTISGLAGGGTVTLQITVTVNTANAISNTAEVIAVDQFDPDSTPGNGTGNGEDDQATSSTQRGVADLSLAKIVNNAAPNVGANVSYTITITNAGPNTATNVAVTDQLAAGLTLVSATPVQGSYNSINGVWTVGSMPSGQSRTMVIVATVTQPGAISNTAEVSASDQFDPNSTPNNNNPAENDQASATITGQQADLSMAKSVSNPQPNIGQNITFTITLSNNGPSDATGVQVRDQIPAGTSFVSANPSRGTYDQTTGVWNVGSISAGISATLQITVTVNTAAAITNTAQVIAADQPDPDSTPNNNDPNEDDQASVSTQQGIADLSLTKVANTTAPNVGDQITFTVTVTNAGPNTATNVAVSEQLSPGLNFLSATPGQGLYNSATGIWTIGSIPAGGSVALQLTALVSGPGPYSNTAQVSHSDQFDPNSTPNNNNPAENDQDTVAITPQQADLALAKSVSNPQPNIGQNITFTITLTNSGPNGATNIQVRDQVPLGTTFVSAVPTQGSYNSATGIWTVPGLASGGTAVLQVTVTVNIAQAITNSAEVLAVDQFDPDSVPGNGLNNGEDDTASITTQQGTADLSLTKTASNAAPNVGANVTFTITVSNAGPNTATNVAVTDQLASGLTFVSANPSQGSYNSVNGVWTIGSIPSGASRTLQITATVTQAGAISNTAEVSASDQFDPNSTPNNGVAGENDQASTAITGQQADLSLAKSVSNPQPNVGQNITFTVTLSNNGPSTATGVQIRDQIPAGTTFVSANPSRGTYDQNTGIWDVGSVMAGISATLQVTVTVNIPGAVTNTAEVIAADQPDPDSTPDNNDGNEDDQASVSTQQGVADLILTKAANTTSPNVGEQVSFTLTLFNAGPNTANNVTVLDLLPPGLIFINAIPGQGTYNPVTGIWNIGSLPAGATATMIQLTAVVTGPGPFTNTAQVASSDQFDPNSTPNNNNPAENDQSSVVITPQQADLSLTKVVNNQQPNIGDQITFTVTLNNTGPNGATNIQVRDQVPLGTTLVSANPSQGVYNPATGIWTLTGLAAGGTATLQITVTVNTANALTNNAEVIAVDQFDPDSVPGNGLNNGEDDTASASTQQGVADLSLTKNTSNGAPNVGSNITFTITISNAGPNTATDVAVSDLLPSGLAFVSANPSQGNYNSVNGLWTIGSVPAGASRTLQIVATVTQPGAITNTAEVVASDQFDPNSTPNNHNPAENDQASVTITGQQADLSLAKAVSNPQPNIGQNITFTITLTNAGPSTATGVQIRDQVPAGTTFVSATPSRGTYDQNTGVWNVGSIGPNITATLQIVVTVNIPGAVTNTAQVISADQPDPDSTPNNNDPNEDDQASVSTQQGVADLNLTKTANTTSPNVGDQISFTVTVFNSGPNNATNVVVLDRLPAGLNFVNAIPSQGTYNPVTGVWNVGTIPAGAMATLIQITATVSGVGPFTNTAQVDASNQFDPDSVPGNNNPAEDDQASVTITPQQADLALAKTVNNTNPNVNDVITFTITLTNSGPNGATGVVVRDQVPLGTTFVSAAPSQGTYNRATGLWTVGGLAAGGTATLQVSVRVNTSAPLMNSAEVIAVDQFDPDSTPGNGVGNGEDDQAVVMTQQGVADLSLTKSVNNPAPNVGTNVTFTLTVTNSGPNNAENVAITDQLAAGLTLVSATPSQGSYNSINGVWTVGTVPNGQSRTLQIVATVTQPGAITNSAQVTTADEADPDSSPNNNNPNEDDQASTVVTGQQADLSMAKSVSNPQPNIGQQITFTVTLNNEGPSTATGVQVRDQIPAGTTFVSATPSRGTYDQNTGVWNVGSIGPNISATLQIVVTVNVAGAITNTAQVIAADQPDPDSTPNNNNPNEDDQASVSTQQGSADLNLTKTVDTTAPNVGDLITFTITVANAGPNTATNVTVRESLPAGLTFVSAAPGQGLYNNANGIWTIGSIVSGGNATLQLTVRVTGAGSLSNSAQVATSDQFDPNSTPNNNNPAENDQDTVVITPQQADLALAKSLSNPQPNAGSNLTYTLTLTNMGPDAATNVRVSDQLPPGVTFVSATPNLGTFNPATGIWTIATVPANATATLQIVVTVATSQPITNSAEVIASDQFDPDSTPGNGLNNGEDDHASVTTQHGQADLSLTKTVNNPSPSVNTNVTFTITLNNAGPNNAENVTVTDQLPAGLTFVSAAPSQGTYNSATGIWTVGTVPSGGNRTLQITATVTQPGAITNMAQVTAADEFDPDSTPNNNNPAEDDQASVQLSGQQADLSLAKTLSNPQPNVGSTLTYTLTVTNSGPGNATGVIVSDPIPAGTTFQSATPSQGTYVSATGIWTVGTIASGSTATLTLNVTVNVSTPITNSAQITASDQFDPDSTPNNNNPNEDDQASVTTQQGVADLSLTKSVNNPAPNVGSTVTFTITLSNAGPNNAENVVVTDLLPPGLNFVNAIPSQGLYNAATGRWTVGTVPSGQSRTLQLIALVTTAAPVVNTAQITDADEFDPDSTPNNNNPNEDDQASAGITPQRADLSLTKAVNTLMPSLGTNVTFTITVTNGGPNAATGVVIREPLAAGLTFISATPSQGAYDPNTDLWTVGAIPAGQSRTLQIVVRVDTVNPTTNTAQIVASDQFDPDSVPNNDDPTEDDQASVTLMATQADLSLTKVGSTASPSVGGNVTFTLTVSNAGPSTATGVVVRDVLPAGLSFVSSPNCTHAAGVVTCNIASIAANANATVSFIAQVTGNGSITNRAEIFASNQPDPDSTPGNGTNNGEDDQAAFVLTISADLAVTKTASPNPVIAGGTVTYSLVVTNRGPSVATGVNLVDALPPGVNFVSVSASQGTCSGTATVTCNLGSLAVNASATVTIQVSLPLGTLEGPIANTASVSSNESDPVTSNNTSGATILVQAPPPGPGGPFPPTSAVSGQKPGSVLFFNVYTSSTSNPNAQNTRINITNTDPQRAARVHLFFVDGSSCSVADAYICLTANQTTTFLASDLDPGTTGYLMAVAVDENGCPINFNALVGDEYVKFASGHAANLAAQSFAGLPGGRPACDETSSTAVLRFDGVSYNRAPAVVALDNIPSRADGNDTLLIVNRLGGNLGIGAATLTAIFGLFYDDAERGVSFGFTPASCQFRSSITNNFPRITPRFEQFIPAGRSGWLKLSQQDGGAILGAAINFNPNAGTSAGAFSQGHNLHVLTLTESVSITIPVFPPSC